MRILLIYVSAFGPLYFRAFHKPFRISSDGADAVDCGATPDLPLKLADR